MSVKLKKENKKPPTLLKTTLQGDVGTLIRRKAGGESVEPKLEQNLVDLNRWWDTEGLPNFSADEGPLDKARLYGAKTALTATAIVPVVLALGFLFLIVYFLAIGGYKQIHIDDPHGGMSEPATPQ